MLVENNISELPSSLQNLKKLTTLWYSIISLVMCNASSLSSIDGNLLRDVDNCLEIIPHLKSKETKLSLSSVVELVNKLTIHYH